MPNEKVEERSENDQIDEVKSKKMDEPKFETENKPPKASQI